MYFFFLSEDKGPEAQSTHMANVSSFDECKQDKTDIVKLQPSEGNVSSTSKVNNNNNLCLHLLV